MISRFYSRLSARRHRERAIALPLLFALGSSCGKPPAGSQEPAPLASVQSLIERAEDAWRERQYEEARALIGAAGGAPDATSAALANREFASALIFWGEYEGGRGAAKDKPPARPRAGPSLA
ncbi:MAG: hypothetical protein GY811_02155 [Myxococcales bacterium]|nr:hypothetical protein [Myxococcales bacterium]